jgi:hypothetical protein
MHLDFTDGQEGLSTPHCLRILKLLELQTRTLTFESSEKIERDQPVLKDTSWPLPSSRVAGSFDFVRLSPHSAQDDSFFESYGIVVSGRSLARDDICN